MQDPSLFTFSVHVEYVIVFLYSLIFFLFQFLVLEKLFPSILKVLLFRTIQCIPQTATWTSFRTARPAILDFVNFVFGELYKSFSVKSSPQSFAIFRGFSNIDVIQKKINICHSCLFAFFKKSSVKFPYAF